MGRNEVCLAFVEDRHLRRRRRVGAGSASKATTERALEDDAEE